MKPATPYIIRHIDLEKLADTWALDTQPGLAYFFVCWWRSLPLGQCFVEPQQQPGTGMLVSRLLEATSPAIGFYLHSAGKAPMDVVDTLKKNKGSGFAAVMQAALEPFAVVLPVQAAVSVIICTRNRSKDLQRCLDSLAAQVCRPQEIIVVDNAPADDSTRQLVQTYDKVIYCREPRGGLSIARNAGLRTATGKVVAFTDDDVTLHPLWVYQVWRSLDGTGSSAMTGLVIPASLDTESQQLFEKEWSFNSGYVDKTYDTAYFNKHLATGPRVWDIGAGANMAFAASIFKTIGYFDERLGAGAAGCSEDSEIWYRILAAGLKIQYNPRAVVFHEHRKELTAFYRQLFSYMRGHTAAALIQQQQHREAGYRRYLLRKLTRTYLPLLAKNAFRYPGRYKMLQIQVRGMLSGWIFYYRNRNKPPQTTTY